LDIHIIKMPYTRSMTANTVTLNKNRWTTKEEKAMIRMLRNDRKSVQEVATELHRSPLSVLYRMQGIVEEHMGEIDGVGAYEASTWLHPHLTMKNVMDEFAFYKNGNQ